MMLKLTLKLYKLLHFIDSRTKPDDNAIQCFDGDGVQGTHRIPSTVRTHGVQVDRLFVKELKRLRDHELVEKGDERDYDFLWSRITTAGHEAIINFINMSPLKPTDLKVGHIYRAKRPKEYLFAGKDDREILWMDDRKVQYDSVSVRLGRTYPMIEVIDFLFWAASDVTEEQAKV